MTNTNDTEGIEVEAPPMMYGEDDADSIEQLPNANDDVVLMNNLPNSSQHASKKYIIVAAFVAVVACTALFNVGMGSALGIGNAINKSNAASVSSASNMAFTASNGGVSAKAAKVAKSIKTPTTKSSKSKSGKSEDSGPGLPVAIPDVDGSGVSVTLPLKLEEGRDCTIANVAIAFGINHPNVFDLYMTLGSPDGGSVTLVNAPPSTANLVPGNVITFDDSDPDALDPRDLGAGLGDNDNIPAGTYQTLSSFFGGGGLGLFNGTVLPSEGVDLTFNVYDRATPGKNGTLESVELTITCAE